MQRRVLVLGGGTGGLVVANRLSHLEDVEVALVDASKYHIFYPSFLWVMTGARTPGRVTRDLSALGRKGVEFLHGRVVSIAPDRRQVVVEQDSTGPTSVDYDRLVVSLGADVAPQQVPGLAEAGLNLYSLDGVQQIRAALSSFGGGRIAILISSIPFKCPAAPYEAAFLIDAMLAKRRVRDATSIKVVTPELQPMPAAGPAIGEGLKAMLGARGIEFVGNTTVEAIGAADAELRTSGGGTIGFDLLVAVPPHRPPKVVASSALAGGSGWIDVDRETLATSHDGVYAIGDVTSIALPGRYKADKPLNLPKAGVFAHAHAEVVARNIARDLAGDGSLRRFDGHGWCMIETGHGRAGMGSGDFYATPAPAVKMKNPSFAWHWGKVLFEKYWMRRWF